MKLLETIFSIKKIKNGYVVRKVVTILGMKFKFKVTPSGQKQVSQELQNKLNILLASIDITKLPRARGNIRLIQDSSISLLNYFTEICKKHNLKYWLDSGTLIGYIRHNGYIPWDDDIDVCMTRKDYNKLLTILDDEYCKNGFKYTHGEIIRLYYKNTPAQVDIFPTDNGYQKAPLEGSEKEKFVKILDGLKSSINFKWSNTLLQQPACNIEDVNKVLARKSELFDGHDEIEDGFIFYGIETCTENRCLYSYEDVFPLKKVMFLGIECFIPNNSEYMLYMQYGDYMSFPQEILPPHNDILSRLNAESFKDTQYLIKNYYPKEDKVD